MRLAIVALALALAGCTSEEWDAMERQPKPTPYASDALFTDGRAMRPLPEGVVAREDLRGPPAMLEGGNADSGFLERSPFPVTAERLDRGEHLFNIYCAACHGVHGDGRSEVARKMALRPPPSLLIPPASSLSDGQLQSVISVGYGMMPSLREWIGAEDRWAVVSYVRALQLSANAPVTSLSADDLAHLEAAR